MLFQRDLSGANWDEVRERQLQRFALVREWIALAGMREGGKVLDIGSGPGVFACEYAKTVGAGGIVYALEKAQSAVDYLRRLLADAGLENVIVLAGDGEAAVDVDGDLDSVMLTDVLHHAERPEAVLRGAKAAMSCRTRLLIAEFDAGAEGLIGPPLDERLAVSQLERMIAAEGLSIIQHGRQAHEHYFFLVGWGERNYGGCLPPA